VPTMVTRVEPLIEVVGCPTVCRDCWAQGVAHQAMPLGDVAWVLEQAHRFCDEHGLGFGAYPMYEVAAHPRAAQILRLFADHVGVAEFEPLATSGVPLAIREDWRELLAGRWSGSRYARYCSPTPCESGRLACQEEALCPHHPSAPLRDRSDHRRRRRANQGRAAHRLPSGRSCSQPSTGACSPPGARHKAKS
jgi:hypothetical protein